MTPVKEIATTNSARRRNRTKPAGSAKTLDLILWVGIGMVCAILFGFMIFSSSDLFIKRHELSNAALVSDASQPKGMVDIAACLANPAENEKLACRYLGLLPQLDSPDFRDKLAAVLKAEAEYVLLPSLALCMLDDARGMPGIISLLEEEEPDSASFEILEANLFSDHFAALNPLHNDYQRASDIQFLINVVEISLPHTFPGSNTSQKREHILEWWREHADETMLEWQIAFLKSDSELNRSTAFQKLSRKAWKEKDLLPHLVRTMKNETNTSLKNHMTVELFKMGPRSF
ncbi:MAG: hypothetical protein U5N86_01905 [Planctomycetota bacterium]|nr:hypothetical protein [Planctomycetota bacterium]